MIRVSPEAAEKIVLRQNRVGVIGYPGAGKTTLALSAKDKPTFHTDDFLRYSHDTRPNHILTALRDKDVFVVEGNEVTRLVNRGLELDALILVEGSTRIDKAAAGLRGRVDKFLREYKGDIYVVNPREK